MSMLSAKRDTLWVAADALEQEGMKPFANLMRDAADTIWDLRDDCVEMRDERDELKDENKELKESLEELMRGIYAAWCADHDAESCKECLIQEGDDKCLMTRTMDKWGMYCV